MYILTIYNDGKRYYSAPLQEMPPATEGTTISSPEIQTNATVYEDGNRIDSIVQKVTEEEFGMYVKDPGTFTTERIF